MSAFTNLLHQAANLEDTDFPWGGNANFAITPQASVIPGQTAYRHQNDGGGPRYRNQLRGTLTGSPETLVSVVENVDADFSTISLYDQTVDNHVARARLTWATGTVDITSTALGSAATAGSVDLGSDRRLIWVTATPNNAGNNRWAIVYPTGVATNTDTAIIHYAGLHEADGYPSALIPTASASVTWDGNYCSVGGVVVPIQNGSPQMRPYAVGRRARAFSGKIISGVRLTRYDWLCETPWLPISQCLTIETALRATAPVAVNHAFTGSAYVGDAHITAIRWLEHAKFAGGERARLGFTIQEAA